MKKLILITVLLLAFVLPVFQPISTNAASNFKDVPNNHWAKKEIDYLVYRGVITGYKDGTFKPNNNVTNAQVAIMLVRALKLDTNGRPNPNFTDVYSTNSAFKEIATAVDEGIFPKGKTFSPNSPISRESMARALANAFKLKGTSNNNFKDVPTTYWAYEYITKVAANNITTGYPDGTFKPKNTVTRAQFSAFVARAINKDYRTNSVSNTTGNVKGSVTWQYNKFIGTKADVGARVFLIPANFNPSIYSKQELEAFGSVGIVPANSNLHFAKVNGFGEYEIPDVPVGEYTIVIASNNTTRNILEPLESYIEDFYKPLLGEGYEIFKLFNLSSDKSTFKTIEIKEDKTIDISHDFGYTYI